MTNTEKKKLGLDTPPRYTYQDVIDDIKSCESIPEEDKEKAIAEIEGRVKPGKINILDVNFHPEGNSKLAGLFDWNKSELEFGFWVGIELQLTQK